MRQTVPCKVSSSNRIQRITVGGVAFFLLALSSLNEGNAAPVEGTFGAGELGSTRFGSLYYEQTTTGFQGDGFFGQPDPLQPPSQIGAFKEANQSISGVFSYDSSLTPNGVSFSHEGNLEAFYQGGTLSAPVRVPIGFSPPPFPFFPPVPILRDEEITTGNLALTVRDNGAGGTRDTFELLLYSGSGFTPNFNGLEVPTLMPQTQTFDLLLDERFVNRAVVLPSLAALPVRLTESNLIVSELSVNMANYTGSLFGSTGLPDALTLADFQPGRSELLLRFRQEYTVSVNEDDYSDTINYELATDYVQSTGLAVESGWFAFSNITAFDTVPVFQITSSEEAPLMPTGLTVPFEFSDVEGTGDWFDPIAANGFLYETDGASKFTRVGLPENVPDGDGLYTVLDPLLGEVVVSAGGFYNFTSPVESFTIMGIDPSVDAEDPQAFPTFLEFNQPIVRAC